MWAPVILLLAPPLYSCWKHVHLVKAPPGVDPEEMEEFE
jgi:hypothetical protein